jgi:hypothetical protein
MAIDIVNLSTNLIPVIPAELSGRFSNLITLFQAIGGLIVAYIIFNIANMFWNRKKADEMRKMRLLLEQINKKLDNKKIVKR